MPVRVLKTRTRANSWKFHKDSYIEIKALGGAAPDGRCERIFTPERLGIARLLLSLRLA
ncbi:hypothetical protein HNQ96_003870 [Aminobacter lissarensis]|uniref:Uncharacterized protein n=1 Tax=Aminobacter carboxidus TaxID=376165 RepID=A0A8E1WGC2_9HYPH|nr:hypothetical protein [Aminobacter lissarensis]